MAEVDTSPEAVAEVCRNLTDDRCVTGAKDRWFVADLLDALAAQRDSALAELVEARKQLAELDRRSRRDGVPSYEAGRASFERNKDLPDD